MKITEIILTLMKQLEDKSVKPRLDIRHPEHKKQKKPFAVKKFQIMESSMAEGLANGSNVRPPRQSEDVLCNSLTSASQFGFDFDWINFSNFYTVSKQKLLTFEFLRIFTD